MKISGKTVLAFVYNFWGPVAAGIRIRGWHIVKPDDASAP